MVILNDFNATSRVTGRDRDPTVCSCARVSTVKPCAQHTGAMEVTGRSRLHGLVSVQVYAQCPHETQGYVFKLYVPPPCISPMPAARHDQQIISHLCHLLDLNAPLVSGHLASSSSTLPSRSARYNNGISSEIKCILNRRGTCTNHHVSNLSFSDSTGVQNPNNIA